MAKVIQGPWKEGSGRPTAKKAKAAGKPSGKVCQIKITLLRIRPPIWRRMLVPADIDLGMLHDLIQTVMGWTNSHLHQFEAGGVSFGDAEQDPDVEDECDAILCELAPRAGMKFIYEYDFGDSWEHEIKVEKTAPTAPEQTSLPVCLAGARAGPPEDCGGVWGYADLLKALTDPKNPDHVELVEWVDPDFDPEKFDLAAINKRLR